MRPALVTLDITSLVVDSVSLLSLCIVAIVGAKTIRSFHQSKQAVIESASLLTVIVDALTSRIQRCESALVTLRSDIAKVARQGDTVEAEQAHLRESYDQAMRQVQEVLSSNRKLIVDLEQLRTKISGIPQGNHAVEGLPSRENFATALSDGDILSGLTSTERVTLEILRVEGWKGAPELGNRLKKSREHTSRLMKKLYMEGFVKRESNRTPFRYKLNDEVRSAL